MKILISVMAALLFAAVSSNAAEISNFKSGLVCFDGKDFTSVCHVTEDIYITGQSGCVWNGENKPCTWYGFSFDYKEAKPGTEIICKFTTSQNIANGNPKEILSKSTKSGEYKIPLEKESGHFFNPQYFLFAGYYKNPADSVVTTETVCSTEGKQVFSYKVKAHFPVDK
jgi:hypothetical protein